MSIEAEIAEIDRPVSDEHPCGEDLEDTQLLASFDAYRIFGQSVPLGRTDDKEESHRYFPDETDWREIKAKSLDALKKSKDFRLLAHFAAAALRLDGWSGFLGTIHVAAGWIKVYWKEVYPPVDDDAILRKNALNGFSDPMSILDGVRRMPIVENRQLGRISLRDVDLAAGKLSPTNRDTAPATEAQVAAVFAAAPLEELKASKTLFETGIGDLKAIDTAMRDFGGAAASPDFDPLIALLVKIDKLVGDELTARGATQAESSGEGQPAESAGGQAIGTGSIKSRQDAIRALDAISTFFRQSEPSSPIPLFLDRAKKLIGKDFLEILADVAPEGVATARSAGGLTD